MKKIIKKKLDEMTDNEIEQLFHKFRCSKRRTCGRCPFKCKSKHGYACLYFFNRWKEKYFDNKDREFEIEVEE